MSRPVYISARRLSRLVALSTVSTFALASVQSTHAQAADCGAGPAGVVYSCSGDDQEVPDDVSLTPTTSQTIVKISDTPSQETELTNDHDLIAEILTPTTTGQNTASLFGVTLADAPAPGVEAFKFTNNGTIDLTHAGVGAVAGVYAIGGAADDGFLVINNGTITVTRGDLDDVTNTINVGSGATNTLTAKPDPNPNGLGEATLNIAAAIRIDEEETFQARIENYGDISASGTAAFGLFVRPTALELVNEGTISASGVYSAAIVTWDGRANTSVTDGTTTTTFRTYGKTFIDNNGTINGNVYVIDASRETFARTTSAGANDIGALDVVRTIAGGLDPFTLLGAGRIAERRDSEISNFGDINGNLYLFGGAHKVTNAQDAEINGSIFVDQRRTILYNGTPNQIGVASRFTSEGEEEEEGGDEALSENYYSSYEALVAANPEHHFTLDNAGVVQGDVKVFTYTGITGATAAASKVDLITHITGSGADSSILDPSTNSGYIAGKLSIGTGTFPDVTTSTVNTANGATVTLTPKTDVLVHSNEYFFVAKDYLVGNSPTPVDTSFLVDWSVEQRAIGSKNALIIGSTVVDASEVEGLSNPGIATLNGLLNSYSDDEAFNALGGALQSLDSGEDVRKASEQLSPDTSFGVQQSAWTLAALQGSAIDARIGSSGSSGGGGSATTGFSQPSGLGMGNGDAQRSNLGASQRSYGPSREGAWGQAFGAHLDDDKDPVNGAYAADIYGFVAGYDNVVSPGFRVGGAFGYGQTDIKEKGDRSGNTTDADSYTATAYAALKGAGWYMTGRTGFTWHDYDTLRKLSVPITDTATGSHEGRQYTASAEVGAPTRMAGAVVTPLASLTYNNLDQDSYTERSGGGMALDVASQQNDSLVSGLGLRALVPIASGTVFEGRAIWLHEFADTNQVVTASFIGADTSFTAGGADVGRDTANLGAALTIDTGAGYSFQANYDAFLREDFVAHAGSGRILVRF